MEADPVTPPPVDPTSAADRPPPIPPSDERLRSHERIPGGVQFRRVMRSGRRRTGRFLVVWSLKRPPRVGGGLAAARLGLSVGRRHGSAAERNLFKRRLRETFRRHKPLIPRGWDWVASPRTPSPAPRFPPPFADLAGDFLEIVRRSGPATPP